jgi:DNA-binding response OmpR family regulator
MEILLIDDNKEITEMVSFFLDSQGISCDVINDGVEGLKIIRKKKYDIVLLDLAMPSFSGYDVVDKLKQEKLLYQNNIVIFTALPLSEDNKKKLISEGIKGIIKKPISIDDIIKTLDRFR